MEARVTLRPGQRGTKKLVQRFGDRLICVRYRYDVSRRKRFTTVELIVDEAPWQPLTPSGRPAGNPPERVGVRVGYNEQALREQVKAAGGRWDADRRLWQLATARCRHWG
ncbi:MAG: hypothetical protein ABI619_05350 [Betaproteobacteria bacterium]